MNIICQMCVHAYFVELDIFFVCHGSSLQLRKGSNCTKIINYPVRLSEVKPKNRGTVHKLLEGDN